MTAAPPRVLAIETSCDETAVAVVTGDGEVVASEVSSQTAMHEPYGGVVPEVASRSHLRRLESLICSTLHRAGVPIERIDAFAATAGPGLATSLMVGLSAAKGLALGLDKPFLAINHLEGHLLSPFMGSAFGIEPAIGLIVSGGHTLLVEIEDFQSYTLLGGTRDDAAGEAFDKVGKLLQLPYPGGPEIERLAVEGDPSGYAFPRSMLHSDDSDFSFSGLKTAVKYMLPTAPAERTADICASFQQAVVEVLVQKTIAAAQKRKKKIVALSGGVSRNKRLRTAFQSACGRARLRLLLADPALCTDNAAMIGYVAVHKFHRDDFSPITTDVDPGLSLTPWIKGE